MTNPSSREMIFPNEIAVDPDNETKAIFVHEQQGLFASAGMVEAYKAVDETYTADRPGRLQFMSEGVGLHNGTNYAFVHDHRDANSKDLLVVMSPLNDGQPESTSDALADYLKSGSTSKGQAKPNSWRPAAKLDSDYEFGHQEGMGMPRLQHFAREAAGMTPQQRRRIASGDMLPYGEVAINLVEEAERARHRKYGSPDFERIHFFAAGMGAKALGAAVHFVQNSDKYQVGSVTLMNFALGEQSLAKLGSDYANRRMVGEASTLILPQNYVRVPEFTALKELDKNGAEFGMRIRQAKALANLRIVKSVMDATQGVDYVEKLLENGSTITIANGLNEAMVAQTDHYLPVADGKLYRTHIVGVDGKKVGQAANEHGAAVALVSNLGLRNHAAAISSK